MCYGLATALLLYDDWTLCVTGWLQHCCCMTTGHCVLRVGYSTVVVRRLDTVCYGLATALLLYDNWTLCVTGWLQHCCCMTTGHCVLRVGYSTVVV